ncbi:MAG: copper resistance protein B [Thermodesulfobacteriota bacterium]|nr:copper resistance protein B [Thermodesulfobacteriota bacterium]
MKNGILLLLFVLIIPNVSFAGGMEDDPLLIMLEIDQLEIRSDDNNSSLNWEVEGWAGKDLHKFWIKAEGEYSDDHLEEMELQALYSRAILPFWDVQLGWRRDIHPSPERDWLAIGLKGLAPYYFDIDAALFIGDSGRTAARFQAEYEVMLTQRLILVPEIELNLYGKDDPATGIGSGLSSIEAGLRLRYEFRREFAPYIGVNWTHLYGQTADYANEEGEDRDNFQFVVGLHAWF